MSQSDVMPYFGDQIHSCEKIGCYFCYEMNRQALINGVSNFNEQANYYREQLKIIKANKQ